MANEAKSGTGSTIIDVNSSTLRQEIKLQLGSTQTAERTMVLTRLRDIYRSGQAMGMETISLLEEALLTEVGVGRDYTDTILLEAMYEDSTTLGTNEGDPRMEARRQALFYLGFESLGRPDEANHYQNWKRQKGEKNILGRFLPEALDKMKEVLERKNKEKAFEEKLARDRHLRDEQNLGRVLEVAKKWRKRGIIKVDDESWAILSGSATALLQYIDCCAKPNFKILWGETYGTQEVIDNEDMEWSTMVALADGSINLEEMEAGVKETQG